MDQKEVQERTDPIYDQVVLTKMLLPSSQNQLLPRPHLFQALAKGIKKNIMIVSAPAGYGKTTMVAEWSKTLSMPVGWLSLGKEEDTPSAFWMYFLHALDRIDPSLIKNSHTLFTSSRSRELDNIVFHCINEITNNGNECCLIIDNFDVIHSPMIHKSFHTFLKYPPPNMKLILLTRLMRDLLYEASSFNHCSTIHKEHFKLKEAEFSQFFQEFLPKPLTSQQLNILEKKTEGWISGMRFFCQTYHQTENSEKCVTMFSGSTPNVYHYFGEQVMSQFDEDMQQFLLETSILDRMNPSLCAAVTNHEKAEDYLTALFKSQGFISLIDMDGDKSYHYHYLFREALLKKLMTMKDGDISYLYQRASTWFYRNGLMEEAFHYSIAGKDYSFSSECLYHYGPQLIKGRNFLKISEWLSAFPNDWIEDQPHLFILHAWVLALQDESENAHSFIERAEKQLDYIESRSMQEEIYLDIEVIKGYIGIVERNKETALEHMVKASEKLPKYSRYFHIGIEFIAGEGFILRSNMAMGGELKKAFELYSGLRQIWKNSGLPVVGYGSCVLADIHYEWDELDKVPYFIKRGIHLGKANQNLGILIPIYFTYARLQKCLYGRDKMWAVLEELEECLNVLQPEPLWNETLKAFHIRLWIEEQKLEKVSKWIEENRKGKMAEREKYGRSIQITMVRALIALHHNGEALIRLEELLKEARLEQRIGNMIELLLIKSTILYDQSEITQAQKVLKQALSIGEPHLYYRIFLDEGMAVYRLLVDIINHNNVQGKANTYYERLCKKFENEYGKIDHVVPVSKLIEPLTKREKDVLHLLNQGYSNKEVASKLFLSIGTVKLYTHKIYSKLQVSNRTQALIRAKELNILQP